jgi:uncharacterized protein YraI
MNRASKVLAAAVSAALAFPVFASAQELAAIVTTDLNLRAGPAPNFPIVATIPANASITVYGCNDARTWCDVQFDNNRGWSYAAYLSIQNVVIPQVTPAPPVVVFEPQTYWATNYVNMPFYADRDRFFGAGVGAGAGAVIGALVGPVGAAIGAAIGGAVGAAIVPPDTVVAYVQQQPMPAQTILLEGEVVLGATIPAAVTLTPVPDSPQFAYAFINGQWVIADMQTRAIIHVIRA